MVISLNQNNKVWFYRIKKQDEKYNSASSSEYINFDYASFLKKFNFNSQAFFELNSTIKKLTAGNVLVMPPSSTYFHVVMPLETLYTIAKIYNCSVEYLQDINGINKVFIGQRIFIN